MVIIMTMIITMIFPGPGQGAPELEEDASP